MRIHLRSDVPVGCALSGGLDSSALAVLFHSQGGGATDLHTFTSTCAGDPTDEREYVEAVLDGIRVTPHFVTPSAQGFLDDLDDFVSHHDEPVGSLSMYAGYCVARTTHAANVPVILSGQGGDEVLSGYWQSYFMYLRELGLRGHMLALAGHLAGRIAAGRESVFARTSSGDAAAVLGPAQRARFLGGTANRGQRCAAAHAGKSGASPTSERDSDDVPAETTQVGRPQLDGLLDRGSLPLS